ncbi:MAG: hypothetical protein ABR593_11575 [Candidatus Limnocylindria bacterium]
MTIVAGTPYTLTGSVIDCSVQCGFMWYVDGEQVASELIAKPSFDDGSNYFDPTMDLTLTYTAGEHTVLLFVWDGDGYERTLEYVLSAAAGPMDPIVTPPTPDSVDPVDPDVDTDAERAVARPAARAAAEAAAQAAARAAAAPEAAAGLPETSVSVPATSASLPMTMLGLLGLLAASAGSSRSIRRRR